MSGKIETKLCGKLSLTMKRFSFGRFVSSSQCDTVWWREPVAPHFKGTLRGVKDLSFVPSPMTTTSMVYAAGWNRLESEPILILLGFSSISERSKHCLFPGAHHAGSSGLPKSKSVSCQCLQNSLILIASVLLWTPEKKRSNQYMFVQ